MTREEKAGGMGGKSRVEEGKMQALCQHDANKCSWWYKTEREDDLQTRTT